MNIWSKHLDSDSGFKSKVRWVMIGFAFLATCLNYIQRLSFNYLSSVGELKDLISDRDFGYIGGFFFVAYTISNAFSGFAIDRLGTKIGYSLCMLVWNTAGLFHSLANNVAQFGVVRFFLGIGEAGNWPAGLKITRDWFSSRERSTAAGIFNTGSAVGAIIVPPFTAYVALNYGWRNVFVWISAAGYLWLVLFWLSYYTPKRQVKVSKPIIIPFKILFRTKFLRLLTIAKFFIDPIWYFVTFWIGRYLVDVYHFDLKQIGILAIFPFIVADLGNLLGGYLTQFLIQRGIKIPIARKWVIGCSIGFIFSPLILGSMIDLSPLLSIIIFGLVGFGYTSFTANTLALVSDVIPQDSGASVWGLASVGTGIGGAIFQSLSGIILMRFTLEFNYEIGYKILFFGYGLMAIIGFLCLIVFIRSYTENKYLKNYYLMLKGKQE